MTTQLMQLGSQAAALLRAVRRREEGQAMVEYALILALVSVVAVVVLASIGTGITGIFTTIANDL